MSQTNPVSSNTSIAQANKARGTTPMRAHKPGMRLLVLLCALCATFAFAGAPADAHIVHNLESQITEVPAGSPCGPVTGRLEHLKGMTVYGGHLYLAEPLSREETGFEGRIDEFDSTTTECVAQSTEAPSLYQPGQSIAIGLNVAETELYVVDGQGNRNLVAVFNVGLCGTLACTTLQEEWKGADTPSGTFGRPSSVAIDASSNAKDWASGDVFVLAGDEKSSVLDIFKPEAGGKEKYIAQLTGISANEHFTGAAQNVAVSGFNGDVVVADGSALDLFEPAGLGDYTFVGHLAPPSGFGSSISSVAVDAGNDGKQSDGEIYAATKSAVYEFSSQGVYMSDFTGAPQEAFGSVPAKSLDVSPVTMAVDPVSHRLFVGVDHSEKGGGYEHGVVDVFGPDLTVPDVETGSVSSAAIEATPGVYGARFSLTLNGKVNPDGAGAATCGFEWGTSSAFGQLAPCEGVGGDAHPVENGEVPTSVHTTLGELEPDTTYFYRLQAQNSNGLDPGEEGQDAELVTPGPRVLSESVAHVASANATLEARIEPHDAPINGHDLQALTKQPTTYFFQYSAEDTVGCDSDPASCTSIPLAPVEAGSGNTAVEVRQRVEGLLPSHTYHYRVVVASEVLPQTEPGVLTEFEGPDQTFSTQPTGEALVLPDGRAWELVSPIDARGAIPQPIGETSVEQAAIGGGAFTYQATAPSEPYPSGYGEPAGLQVLASRSVGGGWSSKDIGMSNKAPVGLRVGTGHEYRFFSEDLSVAIAEPTGVFSVQETDGVKEESPEGTERTPYLRHNSTCQTDRATCYEPLVTGAVEEGDVPAGTKFGGPSEALEGQATFVGASAQGDHVVLDTNVQLTSVKIPGEGLYEWSDGMPVSERLQLVSILPLTEGGKPVSSPTLGNRPEVARSARGAISEDGSRVFFVAKAPGQEHEHLYMRDTASRETIRLDVAEGGSSLSQWPPTFQIANRDGSKVLFTAPPLTAGAGSGSSLYECDIVEVAGPGASKLKCQLTDLTPAAENGSPGEAEPAEVKGVVLGATDDDSYVYFVANGVQAAGAAPAKCESGSATDTCNLYVRHDGVTTFIASLSVEDRPDWSAILSRETSRVSPNGEWLAFMSERSLTGYDNRDVTSGVRDEEVYLYNAVSNKLVCASCDPTGARPAGMEYFKITNELVGGDRIWNEHQWLAADLPSWTAFTGTVAPAHQPRYLSDEGRLFFNSAGSLVPQDSNGNWDVYEYEPAGAGGALGCTPGSVTYTEREGGCVGLISSGSALGESAFMDASATGDDVFFLTLGDLVPEDHGTGIKVYDAHACTAASPCPPPPGAGPVECVSAASCRLAPMSQPSIYGSPSSATFSGVGNTVGDAGGGAKPTVKSRALTRAQQLARALRACGRKRVARQRSVCKRAARKRYGPSKGRSAKDVLRRGTVGG